MLKRRFVPRWMNARKRRFTQIPRLPVSTIERPAGISMGQFVSPASFTKAKGPIPDMVFVQLSYIEKLQYQPSGANSYNSRNVWRSNSVFDPNFTGVGTQPRYLDQYAALYNSYQVFACKAEHTVVNVGNIPVFIAAGWFDNDPSTLTVQSIQESRYGLKWGAAQNDQESKTFSTYMSMKKLHGYKDITQIDGLQAAVTANPADPSFHVICVNAVDDATAGDVWIQTKLTYYVKFFSPANVGAS